MEIFENHLHQLIKNRSVNLLQIAIESQLNTENQIVVGTGSKKDKEYDRGIIKESEVTESENVADNGFNQTKKDF